MPLNVRSIAISTATVFFFIISLIGWFSDLSPFICCKRAIGAAFVVYVVAVLALKAINFILMSAVVNHQMDQQEGIISDNEN